MERSNGAVGWGMLLVCGALASGCAGGPAGPADEALFTRLPASETGVAFANRLEDTQAFNVFTYRNYYNGGGVGAGDFDGDGRTDLYFTANQGPNRLYLNRGDFRFEDVTEAAGVAGRRAWSTGVAVADVNGDGRLDLYVCNAGNVEGDDKQNELFINEGNGPDGVPRFTEQAEAYGLADEGYSTHAAFFDYDRDGDLDLYLLNNSFRPVSSFGLRNIRGVRDARGGDKLFRNDSAPAGGNPSAPRFTDVSEAAGIYGSEIAFGLGVTVGDVDDDGWLDLYISNDFFERDYLYLNNRDGTFREVLEAQMPVLSLSSMGADMADLTGDGRPEIFVTDMLPEGERRLKTTSSYEGYNLYQAKLANDYHHQLMRNMLHRNNADGTFSEVGQIAGVDATDWSWGALFADFDLDGFTDLFVANGIYRDVTDQDFVSFLANEETRRRVTSGEGVDFLALVGEIPSTPIANYAFANDARTEPGAVSFTDRAREWGLDEPGFSNGAAYADLDDDGDLDLVVSNVNMEAFVYRNEARPRLGRHFLQVRLEGEGANRFGVGAKVGVWTAGRADYRELVPQRGFQSSVDYVLSFGLGAATRADSVTVRWPDGRVQTLADVPADRRLTLRQADAVEAPARRPEPAAPLFADVTAELALPYRHDENDFVDFHRESLIPKMLSTEGPAVAVGDVDGDGRDDLFLGGAAGQAGTLLLQRAGRFEPAAEAAFGADAAAEDVDATFFDADADGDLDLYVVSGGNEFDADAPQLQDRLYLNDGRGGFERGRGVLPTQLRSGSTVAPADFDGDGDADLFVGARSVPWRYGIVPPSTLLRNDGHGRFSDVTAAVAPALQRAGLVTDATWADTDGDGDLDLVVVGEWMPLCVFTNEGGRFRLSDDPGLADTEGWWTRVVSADVDGDGDGDLVAGNLGLNTKLRASPERPVTMHVADFDRNGSTEPILSVYRGDRSYPFALRNDLTAQLSYLKRENLRFADYAGRTVADLFSQEQLERAEVRRAATFASALFLNDGRGRFTMRPLPYEAQLAPVYGLLTDDVDGDGHLDLLLAGNFFGVKPDLGRMAASYGLVLRGDGDGGFEALPRRSGFFVPGQTRRLAALDTDRGPLLLAVKNDDAPQLFARLAPPLP